MVALLYIFSPIDLVPDVIPGIGLLDDAAVTALCLSLIKSDLEKYKSFKEEQERLKSEIVKGL